jgi:hypothetical protein
MRLVQLAAFSLLPVTPALGQVAPAVPAVEEKSAAAPERKICRREEGVGSRLNRKICLTREQWAGKAKAESSNRDSSAIEEEPR